MGGLIALLIALATPQFGFSRTADVPFMPGVRGTLDVYTPRRPNPGAPVVVFLYGGNWDSGEKALYRFVGASLARAGVVTVIPDYRVYPEVRFPGFLEDNARAVRWAKDHAASFGADPDRLFLIGHSAGAYDVAMLTLDPRWLAAVGMEPRRDVRGAIGLSGPYDFLPLESSELKVIFGPPERLSGTQPINHVSGAAPPMLLMAGGADRTVDPGNSARLQGRITASGGRAELVIFPKARHADTITALLPVFGGGLDVGGRIRRFIEAQSPVAAGPAA